MAAREYDDREVETRSHLMGGGQYFVGVPVFLVIREYLMSWML